VRKSLLNQFGEIFQAGCGGGTTCTELRHAFRRNDLSGTTDTFYTLLSEAYDNPGPPVVAQLRLPALPTTTTARESAFCNAFGAGNILAGQGDFLDQDPVRRPCGAQEQACRRDGTVGVVVPIEVPGGAALAQLYPTLGCSVGQFELLRLVPPGQPGPTVCPNGGPLALAGCFQPVRRLAPPAATPFDANCVAGVAPVQPLFGGGMSGRAYNLMVKNSAGLLQRDIFQPPAPYPTRFLVGSYFRIHTTQVLPGGTNTCQQPSSTEQLGCVVQASLCSISFAGREAALQPGSLSLSVGGLFPTNANVEALVLTPGNKADDYKLSRKLYFNTVAGFQGAELPGDERALAECASNPATAAAAMTGNGFIPMPASLGVQCEDFDETQCSGVVTNSRACSDNVAPVPGCRTAGQGCVQTGDCCAPLTCTGGSCS
jgi:hypothetical protein